jgi:hypothetical protein
MERAMRHIIALSGGVASAWVADYVVKNIDADAVLYFNDTKWEDKDLYRFLEEVAAHIGKEVFYDSDGRTPEEVFYDQNFLANNRVPLCSRILKAERLQKYAKPGDVLYFGIDASEAHRAVRISAIYKQRGIECRFPLIEEQVFKPEMFQWLEQIGIEMPRMYRLGFEHNNCAGGCVRSGKRQWLHLLRTLPDVYAERERVEEEFSLLSGKPQHFMKDTSLKQLREQYEEATDGEQFFDMFDGTDTVTECIGICGTMN